MRTIGIIGGMSWESSAEYYRLINQSVKARLGGLHSADCLMYSVDFHNIEAMQSSGAWDQAGDVLADAARRLERGGADCVVLATNTMHKVAHQIEVAVDLPLLHIADATGDAVKAAGINSVALLGTRFTMEEDFYKARLVDKYGLTVHVPDADARAMIDRVIFNELVLGDVRDESRRAYVDVIDSMAVAGAEGVILGCTEIGMLIDADDSPLPVFDTTQLHATAAVDFALAEAKARHQ